MSAQESPTRAVISVLEMASLLHLSKSRFYALIQAGIFPRPKRTDSCRRPVYDLDLQRQCLAIRQTGIAATGKPVLFNRKCRRPRPPKVRQERPKPTADHADRIEALKSLGLTTSNDAVETALQEMFPHGWAEVDGGELVRRLFLRLR